jgi:hypothetical protein
LGDNLARDKSAVEGGGDKVAEFSELRVAELAESNHEESESQMPKVESRE